MGDPFLDSLGPWLDIYFMLGEIISDHSWGFKVKEAVTCRIKKMLIK